MTHVTGEVQWTYGIFLYARREVDHLVIQLEDGTTRTMNYLNWGDTVRQTEDKVFALKRGAPIRIGTWGGYDPEKWFCDVEEVRDPVPEFVKNLSEAWEIERDSGGRHFGRIFMPCVLASILEPKSGRTNQNGSYERFGFTLSFFPLDPFFHDWRCILYRSRRFYGISNGRLGQAPIETWAGKDFPKELGNIPYSWSSEQVDESGPPGLLECVHNLQDYVRGHRQHERVESTDSWESLVRKARARS